MKYYTIKNLKSNNTRIKHLFDFIDDRRYPFFRTSLKGTRVSKSIVSIVLLVIAMLFLGAMIAVIEVESAEIPACVSKSGKIYLIGDEYRRQECRWRDTAIIFSSQVESDTCKIPRVAFFVDTISDNAVDTDTVDYWDGVQPSLQISDETHSVFVAVSVSTSLATGADATIGFKVHRNTGAIANCTDEIVGSIFTVFGTNVSDKLSITKIFVDTPQFVGEVFYTLCSSDVSQLGFADIEEIRFTLFETK